ncbi:tryptophan--tRNA ligase [candidate division KSB1 bacterium]
MAERKRILSGMRPSGRLHLGNFVGALENWVRLQGEYQNFHLIADWHVLTTAPDKTDTIYQDTIDMVIDWIGAGLDPVKSPMFIQSQIKEHAELHLLFSMITSVSRLERNPTVKEQVKELQLEETMSYGHLGYPVLQAADILIYKAHLVPVGEDQVPHVELTREIARRFNNLYGKVFPEPEVKLTPFSRLPGSDGRKMSKSYGNIILLSEDADTIRNKLRKAVTDPEKIRKGDPGHPEICLVYNYHQRFNSGETDEIAADCRSGALGCVDCKNRLADKLVDTLEPFRANRAHYQNRIDEIVDILEEGNKRAREEARSTMNDVYKVMKIG